jgi:hypothetical protein
MNANRSEFPDAVGVGGPDASMLPEESSGGGAEGHPHETLAGVGSRSKEVERTQLKALATNAPRASDLLAGARRLALAERLVALRAQGRALVEAASAVGVSPATASRLIKLFAALPPQQRTAAAFAPRRRGPRPAAPLLPGEIEAVKKILLQTNRDWKSGSLPEALRAAGRRGLIRAELAQELAAREALGLPLPRPLRRQTRLSEAHVRAFRCPRQAWLDYVSSAGSLQFTVDPETGQERLLEPGEQWTIDDGTLNLICNVPSTDPRWKFGVMPGRFQFLVVVDHRSYFIPGFSFTARPRGSYRAEDLLATLQIAMLEHGRPRRLVLEHGVSAAHSISRACELAGIEIVRASSPHQKVVELVFGCLWTKLSLLPGQVGRFRGEHEGVEALYECCRRGSEDPREHFPMLGDVLRALREAIADWNSHWVNGSRYGRWQPAEFWARRAPGVLRPLPAEDAWMFAPRVTEPLRVRGLSMETSVLLAPGFSQRFTFGAEWLVEWVGARVRLHFNPFTGGPARAVLAENWRGEPAGRLLGDLEMFDRQARYTLRAWGYADLADDGGEAAARQAQALHRSIQAIRPDNRPGRTAVEIRTGVAESTPAFRDGGLPSRGPAPALPRPPARARWRDPRLADFTDIPL